MIFSIKIIVWFFQLNRRKYTVIVGSKCSLSEPSQTDRGLRANRLLTGFVNWGLFNASGSVNLGQKEIKNKECLKIVYKNITMGNKALPLCENFRHS